MMRRDFQKTLYVRDVDIIWQRITGFWESVLKHSGYGFESDKFSCSEGERLSGRYAIYPHQGGRCKLALDEFCTQGFVFRAEYHELSKVFSLGFEFEKERDCPFGTLLSEVHTAFRVGQDDVRLMEELFEYFLLENFTEKGKERVLYFAEDVRKAQSGSPAAMDKKRLGRDDGLGGNEPT